MKVTPLDTLTRIHKALAHPVRVRILAMLREGELCVCQINAVIGLAPSTMSAHLADLRNAGLVAERKAGRWVHYRLAGDGPGEGALAALWPALDGDRQVSEDAELLGQLTRLPVAEICRPGFDLGALRARCCPGPATGRHGASEDGEDTRGRT